MVVFDPSSPLDTTGRRPNAVPGGPPVTPPYQNVPLPPPPAGTGVVPARAREADYPFDPRSGAPTGAGVGGRPGAPGGPAVTLPYSGTPLGAPPAGAGVIPARDPAAGAPVLPDWEYVGTPYRAPVPAAPADDGGGDGGGGGGGGAGSGSSWAELMEQQRRAAEAARRRLEGEYATRRDELRSQYQLSETDEERAQLAFLMAELDAATERADQAIVAGYANAVQNIQGLGGRAGTAADIEAQTVQDLFLNAAQRYAGMVGDVQQQTGLQAGLAGTAFGPAEDFMGLLSADAAREAALTQRLGGIVSQEMTDAERRMAFQQASQQADLQRESAASGAQTRADQQAAVAARIAQERRDLANNIRQLQTTYATLGAGFDQQYVASYGEQAGLAQSEALFLADLASRERVAAANRAAQLEQLEAQWARDDAMRPDWQTDELAAATFRWNQMTDIEKSRPGAFEDVFGGLLPGVESRGRPALPGRPDPSLPGESPRGPQSPPLVEIPDEQLEAERDRRAAEAQSGAARQEVENAYRTRRQWESAGMLPPGTADRLRQEDIERYEAQYGPW